MEEVLDGGCYPAGGPAGQLPVLGPEYLGQSRSPGLPPEILELPSFEQKCSKNSQFYVILYKIYHFTPFLAVFDPNWDIFTPILKIPTNWKWSVYRPMVGIPTSVAALASGQKKVTQNWWWGDNTGMVWWWLVKGSHPTLFYGILPKGGGSPGLPLRSVYRPLVGIPTISVGRYFLTWGKNALIWVKNSQKMGKNGKFCTKLCKIGHFGTFFVQKGGKSKISGGSPGVGVCIHLCL